MFEDYDFDNIMADMIESIDEDIDTREGSVIYDAIAPMALELSNYYEALSMVYNEVFADTASYYYLIKRAAERGIFPKEATQAVLKMKVTPTDSVITVGDTFGLEDMLYVVTSTIDSEKGSYQVQCQTEGTVGNQQLGNVIPVDTADELNGLETAVLTEVIVPGEDEEDVETLRERYYESFVAQSFGGNKKSYIDYIKAIDGVGQCKVIREWEQGYNTSKFTVSEKVAEWYKTLDKSALDTEVSTWIENIYNAALNNMLTTGGTIRVVIIDSENKVPSDTLVKEVQNALDPGANGEGIGIAPMGHVVNVEAVKEEPIYYYAKIDYEDGYSFAAVKEELEKIIDEYHAELIEVWDTTDNTTVRGVQLANRFQDVKGIANVYEVYIGPEPNAGATYADPYKKLAPGEIPARGGIIGK